MTTRKSAPVGWAVAGILLGALGLPGCSNQSDRLADLKNFVAEGQNTPAQVTPLPQPPQSDAVVYTGEADRNPFTSFDESRRRQLALEMAKGPKPDLHRVRQTLEAYDLSSLSLVGIVQDAHRRPWAIIKAPDGKTYRITLGSYLGRNNGRLVGFDQQPGDIGVRVLELVPGVDGGYEKREQHLEMKN